jgi:hypothetical protein
MRSMRFLIAAAALVLAGCGGPARSYRLFKINGVPAIAPPAYKDGDKLVEAKAPGVRGAARAACEVNSQDFRLRLAGKDAVITVDLGTLFPDGAYDNVAHNSFEAFRVAVEKLEEGEKCLRPGAGRLIAERVAEALPVPFQDVTFYRNRYDPYRTWVDLQPGMRVIRQAAVPDAAGNGAAPRVETVEYRVLERAGTDGVRFDRAPDEAPDLPHQRLFLRTIFYNAQAGRPEQHATLVSARDLTEMSRYTAELDTGAATVCDAQPSPCRVFPHRFTVVPEIAVSARGRQEYFAPVSSVGELLRRVYGAKPLPPKVVETLTVEREYAGKHIKIDLKGAGDLALRMPLVGGDRIRWSE